MSLKLILPFSVLGLGSAATASAGIYSHASGPVNGTVIGQKASATPDSENPNTQSTETADPNTRSQTSEIAAPQSPSDGSSNTAQNKGPNTPESPANPLQSSEKNEDATPAVQKPDGTSENESLPKEGKGSSNASEEDQVNPKQGSDSSDSTQGGQKDGSTTQTDGPSAIPSSKDSAGGTGGSSTTEGSGEHSPAS